MKRRILAAAALAVGLFSGPVAQAAPSDPTCLQPINLYGWNVINDRTLIVTDQRHRNYKVSLIPGCFGLKFDMRLGFKPFSQSRLSCMTHGDYVVAPSDPPGSLPQRCQIDSVVAYTPEMQHADAVAKAMDKPH